MDALLPPSSAANQPIRYHAKPEVHDQPPIHLKGPVARQMKHGSDEEVGDITHNNGAQSLEQIHQHAGFRRRLIRLRLICIEWFDKGSGF
jgi:hypothetical protein